MILRSKGQRSRLGLGLQKHIEGDRRELCTLSSAQPVVVILTSPSGNAYSLWGGAVPKEMRNSSSSCHCEMYSQSSQVDLRDVGVLLPPRKL